jgi:predicted RNA methylase
MVHSINRRKSLRFSDIFSLTASGVKVKVSKDCKFCTGYSSNFHKSTSNKITNVVNA